MTCTADGDAKRFSLRIQGERRSSAIFHLLAGVAVILIFHYCLDRGNIRDWGQVIGYSWAIGTVMRQQFGVSELIVDSEFVTLNRHTLGIGRSRRFPRADTERLGYLAGDKYDDSALGLMVRTVMMPLHFAHGINAQEATLLFQELRLSGSWMGLLIRSVGTPLF